MKKTHTFIASMTLICGIALPSIAATYESGGKRNSCVKEFFDPAMYNWYSIQNTCSIGITVRAIANDPGYGGHTFALGSGRKASTGATREEVNQKGGYSLAVCKAGFVAVDGDGGYWNRAGTPYRCKQN